MANAAPLPNILQSALALTSDVSVFVKEAGEFARVLATCTTFTPVAYAVGLKELEEARQALALAATSIDLAEGALRAVAARLGFGGDGPPEEPITPATCDA